MRKTRVNSQADHQPAASHSRDNNAQQKDVSLTLSSDTTAQAKRVDSLQENPAQLAVKSRTQILQEKPRSSLERQSEGAVQRVEEEELQGKFETAQLMEEDELQGKFETAQLMEEEELQGKFETAQLMEEEELQGKFETAQLMEEEELQGKFETTQMMEEEEPLQGKANDTGMPDNLKAGVESLSGVSMDGVQVHYNSDKPAQLNALAYAQGTDIHVGPGQEQHLPHEAWHVAQQAQGRVKPTVETDGGTKINDDTSLETEADVMGAKAAQFKPASNSKKSKN